MRWRIISGVLAVFLCITLTLLAGNGGGEKIQLISWLPSIASSRLTELVSKEDFVSIPQPECVSLSAFPPNKMCIKPIHTDVHVSGLIKSQGGWETDIVRNVVRVLNKYLDAVLLDIGCNIGMYTVVAAGMQRQVIAVDADPRNLAYLRTSLDLNNSTNNVRILYNAVSNEKVTLYPMIPDPSNEGAVHMYTEQRLQAENLKATLPPVDSITMAEILATIKAEQVILKIDIEGYECKALPEEIIMGSSGKRIPFIFLEWGQLAPAGRLFETCPEYNQWKAIFHTAGYIPHSPGSLEPVQDENLVDKAWDLLWVHKDVQNDFQSKFLT